MKDLLKTLADEMTPLPEQQAANRRTLIHDLESGIYRQGRGAWRRDDGVKVCILEAAYHTYRRIEPSIVDVRPAYNHRVIKEGYGIGLFTQIYLMCLNDKGYNFAMLAKEIAALPPPADAPSLFHRIGQWLKATSPLP